jgi:predicted RNA-binding Zn-ribbon protein involved in translation (DUF1610 family)
MTDEGNTQRERRPGSEGNGVLKPKPAGIVFQDDRVIFECPFCGRTLIRSNLERCRKLVDASGPPRGKVCTRCGGTALLQLDEKSKRRILVRARKAYRNYRDEPTIEL